MQNAALQHGNLRSINVFLYQAHYLMILKVYFLSTTSQPCLPPDSDSQCRLGASGESGPRWTWSRMLGNFFERTKIFNLCRNCSVRVPPWIELGDSWQRCQTLWTLSASCTMPPQRELFLSSRSSCHRKGWHSQETSMAPLLFTRLSSSTNPNLSN